MISPYGIAGLAARAVEPARYLDPHEALVESPVDRARENYERALFARESRDAFAEQMPTLGFVAGFLGAALRHR